MYESRNIKISEKTKEAETRNVENVSQDVIVYHFLVEIGIFASTYFEKYYLCIAYIRNISKNRWNWYILGRNHNF